MFDKQATHLCFNNNCDKIAFVCGEKQCECYKQHKICPHVSLESISNSIEAKIIPYERLKESILNKIDKTID